MAAPTYVGEYETVFNTTTTPKTSPSMTIEVGDPLIVCGLSEDDAVTLGTPTNTGTAQTWTLQQSVVVADYGNVYIWTAVASAAQTMTINTTRVGTSGLWGFNVIHWTDSDGIGASSKTNVSSGAPSLGLTTVYDNSGIVVCSTDWNATDGVSRVWRTVNGAAALENTYFRDAAAFVCYAGRHPDAGALGAKTVGLSAPAGQKYGIAAVEIRGTAGGAVAAQQPLWRNRARHRAATW